MTDFGPLSELPGQSVLAFLFIDCSHAILPGGLNTQQRLVARSTRSTHPAKLLQLLKDKWKVEYLKLTLTTAFPPPLKDYLCPARSPGLVSNGGLCGRIGDSRLTRGNLLQIILPFLQCYYSSNHGFGDVVQQMSTSEISSLVYTPGAVKQHMM